MASILEETLNGTIGVQSCRCTLPINTEPVRARRGGCELFVAKVDLGTIRIDTVRDQLFVAILFTLVFKADCQLSIRITVCRHTLERPVCA
jgi:hypothetical protein